MTNEIQNQIFSADVRANIPIYPQDVFALTDRGTAEIQRGTTDLPPEALVIMVAMDGKATIGDIEQKALQIPPENLRNLVRSLLASGFVRPATIEETEGLDFSAFFAAAQESGAPSEGARASATQEAVTGHPQLKRDGYYVSIARKAVRAKQPASGARLSILVVEDEPVMAMLVVRILQDQGFDADTAANRDEIRARLRRLPMPDAVILDVTLVDINGFDVLNSLKKHAVLKTVPVIMLTADARRGSVMRGLAGGADGYITKPFAPKILIEGVKAILGLASARISS